MAPPLLTSPPLPSAPPSSSPLSPPSSSPVQANAIQFTIDLIVEGSVDSFETAAYEAKLREYLQCFEAACTIALEVTAASVKLHAVVTDTSNQTAHMIHLANLLMNSTSASIISTLGVKIEATPVVTELSPSSPLPSSPPAQTAPSPPDERSRAGGAAREQELPGGQSSDVLSGGESFLRYGLWAVLLLLLAACGLAYYLLRRKQRWTSPPRPGDASRTTIDASPSNGAEEAGGTNAASREVVVKAEPAAEPAFLGRVSAVTSRLFRMRRGSTGAPRNATASADALPVPDRRRMSVAEVALVQLINATASARFSQRSSSSSLTLSATQSQLGEGDEGGTSTTSLRMSGASARARLASGASALRLPPSSNAGTPRASAAGGGGEAGEADLPKGAALVEAGAAPGGGAQAGHEAGPAPIDEVWAGFEAAVRGSFEAYDTSGAGRLSPADAEAALGAVGLQLAPGQLTQLLQLHGGAGSAQSDTVTLDDALGVLALILEG